MTSRFQTAAKSFRVRAYADSVTTVSVDLKHDEFPAVIDLLQKLNEASGSYGPRFAVDEIDAEGEVLRSVILL